MNDALRILHLEDMHDDATLVERQLRKGKLDFILRWVVDEESFEQALTEFNPDVILSDHSLPGFDSLHALHMLREKEMNVPFILVTATVSEEFAVSILREGAEDYILKDRMERLPDAVLSAVEKYRDQKAAQHHRSETIRNEKKFRGMIEHTNDLIGIFDKNFKMIYRSPNYERITGWSNEELADMSGLATVHPEDIEYARTLLSNVVKNPGKTFSASYRLRHKDQSFRWVEGVVVNMLNDEAIGGIVSNLRDVTENRVAALELRQAHERLMFHLDNGPLGFVEWDNTMQMKSWSARAQEIFGWQIGEFRAMGRNVYHEIYEDDRKWVSEKMKELLSGVVDRNHFQCRNTTKTGSVIWCEWFNSVLKDSEGKVVTIMSLVQNITERKTAEEEKSNLLEQLVRQNNDLLQFSFITSHSLRGPVASLLGLLNFVNPNEVTGETATILPYLRQASLNLDNVVSDIGQIVNMRAGEIKTKETVNILNVIESTRQLLEGDKETSRIEFDLSGIHVTEFYTIRTYFNSILYNLISNAIKFQSPIRTPKIEIITAREGKISCITIRDNGLGIDLARFGDKLFGFYQRFNLEVEGKGLGLFIVKTQVEMLNGTIEIQSIADKGTEVILRL